MASSYHCQSRIARCKHIQPLFAVSFAISQTFCQFRVILINQFFDALKLAHTHLKRVRCADTTAPTLLTKIYYYDTLSAMPLALAIIS